LSIIVSISPFQEHEPTEPPTLTVEVRPDRERVIVAPFGEIDLGTVGMVRERLEELEAAGFEKLVLDLRGVTFIDSTGLRLVLDEARNTGIQFGVIPGPDAVQRVFELTGTAEALPFIEPGRVY